MQRSASFLLPAGHFAAVQNAYRNPKSGGQYTPLPARRNTQKARTVITAVRDCYAFFTAES